MAMDREAIKKLYPGVEDMLFNPMLIHASTDSQLKKACNSGEYFGQLKKDGALYIFMKGINGEEYLFGRTVSKKTGILTEKLANVPHIATVFNGLPNQTIVLGEIYYPGGRSRNVTEIMGCLPDKAIARQRDRGLIHYYIYDILMYDGINFIKAQTDNWTRYQIISKLFHLYHYDTIDFLDLAESWTDNLYTQVGQALADGEEGMVIKLKTGIYEPDKRPLSNLKAKKIDYIDAVIIGFEAPTFEYYGKDITNWPYWIAANKNDVNYYQILPIGVSPIDNSDRELIPVTKAWYMGWMNSRIVIGAYDNNNELIKIGVIHSGISDEMKEDMTAHPNNYLNKVVKIQCMEKDSQALTLRHGFYRGMNEEKNPEDCTISTIF